MTTLPLSITDNWTGAALVIHAAGSAVAAVIRAWRGERSAPHPAPPQQPVPPVRVAIPQPPPSK